MNKFSTFEGIQIVDNPMVETCCNFQIKVKQVIMFLDNSCFICKAWDIGLKVTETRPGFYVCNLCGKEGSDRAKHN